jgi:uncharacterized membrane protein SpoIIM required for sporulation
MTQDQFTQQFEPVWRELESVLEAAGRRAPKGTTGETGPDLPRRYRQACHHLALGRSRGYSPVLLRRLEHLVGAAQRRMYPPGRFSRSRIMRFLASGFPAEVRANRAMVLLSALLFFGPLSVSFVAAHRDGSVIQSVMDADSVERFEQMYSSSGEKRVDPHLAGQSDFYMFGYYIRNNTGIGFQTFAGGLVFGLGAAFFLVLNGLIVGAVAGHVTGIGHGEAFWSFVAGHSALELSAIVLCGSAGLRLGLALIAPGRASRLLALRRAARPAGRIVAGAALMFLAAAFIEAFWSSGPWPGPEVKILAGLGMWVLVALYFARAGLDDVA